MARIILIRHPKTVVPLGVCYGVLDVEADEAALEAAVAHNAPHVPPGSTIISSSQRRALALAERLGPIARVDPRLVEMNFGDWETKRWDDEIPRAELDEWSADIAGYRPPGGESLNEVALRVRAAWQECLPQGERGRGGGPLGPALNHSGKDAPPLVIVSHGGPLRIIAAEILGMPVENSLRLEIAWGTRAEIDFAEHGPRIRRWSV